MARCFCGCGREAAFARRSVNRRGARIDEELRLSRALFAKGMRSPNAAALVRDGELLRMQLAEAVHTGEGPTPEVDREARDFIDLAHEHFGPKAFGKALKRDKLKDEQAMLLLEMGDWDPFASSPPPPAAGDDDGPRPVAPPSAPPPEPAPGGDLTSELERLARLHDAGALTDEEFTQAKRRLLERADS